MAGEAMEEIKVGNNLDDLLKQKKRTYAKQRYGKFRFTRGKKKGNRHLEIVFRDQRRQSREERKQHLEIVLENNVKGRRLREEQMKNQQNKDEFLEEIRSQERINPKNKLFEIKIRSALMK